MNMEVILDLVFLKNGAIKVIKMVWWLQENLLVVKKDLEPPERWGEKVWTSWNKDKLQCSYDNSR